LVHPTPSDKLEEFDKTKQKKEEKRRKENRKIGKERMEEEGHFPEHVSDNSVE